MLSFDFTGYINDEFFANLHSKALKVNTVKEVLDKKAGLMNKKSAFQALFYIITTVLVQPITRYLDLS